MIELTATERVILENVPKEYKQIARNGDGFLNVYKEKPYKIDTGGCWIWIAHSKNCESMAIFNHVFQFVRDNELCNIKELLNKEGK